MFIPNHDPIGSLSYPLAGLVLHYGEGGPGTRPSEAAWVGSASQAGIKPPSVHVYVSRSSLNTMKAVYRSLGEHVSVMPLLFNESELDAQAILSMMAVGSSESAPLYMQIVLVSFTVIASELLYLNDDRVFYGSTGSDFLTSLSCHNLKQKKRVSIPLRRLVLISDSHCSIPSWNPHLLTIVHGSK